MTREGFCGSADARFCELYVRGFRVGCVLFGAGNAGLYPEALNARADELAGVLGAPLVMARLPGFAPEGWITVPLGYAKPPSAPSETLALLTAAHFAAARGLYGLFAGRFSGLSVREDPSEWDKRLSALRDPRGLIEDGRLLLWLDAQDGALLELSAAPDAFHRIPGALQAAGVVRAPAPLLDVPAETIDETFKLRLVRPFSIPGSRIETPEALARAMDGAVRWDG